MAYGEMDDKHQQTNPRSATQPSNRWPDWFREFNRANVPHVSGTRLGWTNVAFAATAAASVLALDRLNNNEDAYIASRNLLLLSIAILVIVLTVFFSDAHRAARCLFPDREFLKWNFNTVVFFKWRRIEVINRVACSPRSNGLALHPLESGDGVTLGRIWWASNAGFWIVFIAALAVAGNNFTPWGEDAFPEPDSFVAELRAIAYLIAFGSCVIGAIYCSKLAIRVSKIGMQKAWDDNCAAHRMPNPVDSPESSLRESSSNESLREHTSRLADREEASESRPLDSRFLEDQAGALSENDRVILEDLKKWRARTAQAASVPEFVICTDRTLLELCTKKPTTITDLSKINGIGEVKVARFGVEILSIVK